MQTFPRRSDVSRAAVAFLVAAAWVGVVASGSAHANPTLVLRLSAGANHTCAVLGDGTVDCWGAGSSGQLGDGATVDSTVPVGVVGLSAAIWVSAGQDHTCAVMQTRTVKCWGGNSSGQLGVGTTTNSSVPVDVPGLTGVAQVSAGYFDTCALLDAGTVKCWGDNQLGELGNGAKADSAVPVDVSGLVHATQVWAGIDHNCALIRTGAVKCWGWDRTGDDPRDFGLTGSVPTDVAYNSNQISVGGSSCALDRSGSVKCWGVNGTGQLGNGSYTDDNFPVHVAGLTAAIAVQVGGSHSCAVVRGGAVKCWGLNSSGQLGNGLVADTSNVPVDVLGLRTAALGVVAGGSHTCALLISSTVQCWGGNSHGQLGDGTTVSSSVPVDVSLPGAPIPPPIPSTCLRVDGFSYSTSNAGVTAPVVAWDPTGINNQIHVGDVTMGRDAQGLHVVSTQVDPALASLGYVATVTRAEAPFDSWILVTFTSAGSATSYLFAAKRNSPSGGGLKTAAGTC